MSNRGSLLRSISRTSSSSSVTLECIEFIRSLLSAPDFGDRCSTDRDLCEVFIDGEILCSIATELGKNRIKSGDALVSSFYSVNSAILAKKNVRFFLKHCRETFGLEECDLFEPEDLLGLRNPERVVKTVHRLLVRCAAIKVEAAIRPGSELASVVQEICNSERQLFDKLLRLMIFRKELLGALSEWSEDLVYTVFRHTEQLYLVHKEFLAKLTALAGQGCRCFCQQIGPVFSELCPRFEIYFQHFSHLPTAGERLDAELAKFPELMNQLSMLERIICPGNSSFRSLYDATLRQLFNYQLLFGRLSKAALKEAPDTQHSVERALSELKRLLDRANIIKRQAEQTDATSAVLAKITGLPKELSRPSSVGFLLIDGMFSVRQVSANESKTKSRDTFVCVLTSKYLLVAAKAANKQPHTYWFNVPITNSLQTKRRDAASLEIVLEAGARIKLSDPNRSQSSDKWIAQIAEAKAACFPDGWNANGHVFELTTCPAGTECTICKELLNGSVLQGYRCQKCSFRIHFACLKLVATGCGARGTLSRGSVGQMQTTAAAAANYFHPRLDRNGAVALLQNRPVGTYLLRAKGGSSSEKVLSIRIAHPVSPVIHIEVQSHRENGGRLSLGNPSCTFASLDELIGYYKHNDLSTHFSQLRGKLVVRLEPVS